MRRIRFNIASLLGVILVLGVGFAALRESSELWESGVFTLTLGVLLISIFLAIHGIEKRRAFWLGFAFFGWVYLALYTGSVNRIQAYHDQGARLP